MPLFAWIALLVGKSSFLSVLLVLLLLAFQTYYLNATLSANEVLNKKNKNLLLLIFPAACRGLAPVYCTYADIFCKCPVNSGFQ